MQLPQHIEPCQDLNQLQVRCWCQLHKAVNPLTVLQTQLEGQVAATAPYKTAEQQTPEGQSHFPAPRDVPRLAVVLMAAGTRGDVQPFIALGLQLKVSSK